MDQLGLKNGNESNQPTRMVVSIDTMGSYSRGRGWKVNLALAHPRTNDAGESGADECLGKSIRYGKQDFPSCGDGSFGRKEDRRGCGRGAGIGRLEGRLY